MGIDVIGYRPWRDAGDRGKLRPRLLRFWPIARSGFTLLVRRRSFWVLLVLGLFHFLFYFAIIYGLTELNMAGAGRRVPPFIRGMLFTATGDSYRQFLLAQGTVVMMMLAFAGSYLVGNDFRFHSLAFYLSRPIGKFQYYLGKLIPLFSASALLTLVPALVLFFEYGAFTNSFDYWIEHARVFFAILGCGLLISLSATVVLLGVAAWCRRTLPILLVWGGVFFFLPLVAGLLRRHFRRQWGADPWPWSLMDFWSNLRWISNVLFGYRTEIYGERIPWSLLVIGGLLAVSVAAFWRRIRATEVVR